MAVFPAFGPGAETHSADHRRRRDACASWRRATAPVVFVPGGDQTADAYSQQFARLSDRFRCIATTRAAPARPPPRPRHGAWRTTPATAPP
jgi:3-oxoadipate enol-lactonase